MLKLLLLVFTVACVAENLKPIIGIIAQPTDSDDMKYGKSYIAASYVKFIESAGGRVVPIVYDTPEPELKTLFNQINGVLIPGGDADIAGTTLYQTTRYLYNLALQANDNGDYFPIEGHCMGFQLLSLVTTGNYSLLDSFDSENLTLPLNFKTGYTQSRIFGNADQRIIDILASKPVTFNNHHYGVSTATYKNDTKLNSFYRVLSTNVDRKQKEFLSTIEGIKYPIYGLQWHAEKPLFEWNSREVINHSTDAIKAMQFIADFFVSEARKSMHKFLSPEQEYAALIYNYQPKYTASFEDFDQVYYFN